jgi:hypothetical protein
VKKLNILRAAFISGLLAGSAVGEVTEFRLGHAVDWLLNVFGINFLDLTSAGADLFYLLVLVAVIYYIWRRR